MSMFNVFDVAGSAMSAQSLRLNLTASNLANAETTASSPEQAYRARQPVFSAALQAAQARDGDAGAVPVEVRGVVESEAPVQELYRPNSPQADNEGYVYRSNVNPVEEMVNMISASRSYQNSVEVMSTSRDLMLQTLRLGR
ncbi:Flagellar basal-body rod protein FlgC [wastewater metagenome]|uniref:Flagellar basal-body rod protein FlgC n=2 Tax=unclassified sequences TaxID=12908 RepID=A0A5B8R8V8_9ZZZZ|nr:MULTISPECIES: flagellar basal body rod protein FlgC [Arhodomonas]MCS4502816.1 flagellar basal body rod protein FlgC [Arhodomonas aquaeolei]QEA03702.1 flagellar basal-body rod protein FlgC [uncultured organism]